jgi:hypothetical protein
VFSPVSLVANKVSKLERLIFQTAPRPHFLIRGCLTQEKQLWKPKNIAQENLSKATKVTFCEHLLVKH